jgi:AcrR family transcriptional regulator
MSLQGGLSIERMCQLAGVSKSGFYRHLRTRDTHDEEIHVTIANNQRGGIEGRDLSDARALVRDSGPRWPSLELLRRQPGSEIPIECPVREECLPPRQVLC